MKFAVVVMIAFALIGCKGSKGGSGSNGDAKIGDTVKFDDSEWVVIEAKDVGKTLKSNSVGNTDEKKATGRFIQIHYKVTNTGKQEQMVFKHPKVIDGAKKEFEALEDESNYVPAKTSTIGLVTLVPNVMKEYWSVIDVGADSKTLKLRLHPIALIGDEKDVDLNL